MRLLDLESTNGTLVNGVPAPPDAPVRLADGDELRLGQVALRYAAPLEANLPCATATKGPLT